MSIWCHWINLNTLPRLTLVDSCRLQLFVAAVAAAIVVVVSELLYSRCVAWGLDVLAGNLQCPEMISRLHLRVNFGVPLRGDLATFPYKTTPTTPNRCRCHCPSHSTLAVSQTVCLSPVCVCVCVYDSLMELRIESCPVRLLYVLTYVL